MSTRSLSALLSWAAKNERRLGAALFAFGFLTDFFTFGLLPVQVVNVIFIAYLVLAGACALGAHAFAAVPENSPWWRRSLSILFPLGVQYAFGGLLSGFVVFYTAHSVILASWPFLLFLALVYIGNEYFRMYKHYLVFQTTIFFFALYAYAIFGLPLFIGRIGPWTFLGSTIIAFVLFLAFLYLLRLVNRRRFEEEFRPAAAAAVAVIVVITGSYFMGVIPPIPLAMKDAGVYHSLIKIPDGYLGTREAPRAWFDPRPPVVRLSAGEPLYAYSAVAAPISFSSTIVHRWEQDIPGSGWTTESKIAFPITGGREGGYRGYSTKTNMSEGQWRVSVETPSGQVIGRIRFDIERTAEPPVLIEKAL